MMTFHLSSSIITSFVFLALIHCCVVHGIITGIPFKIDVPGTRSRDRIEKNHNENHPLEIHGNFDQGFKLDHEWNPEDFRLRRNKPFYDHSHSIHECRRPSHEHVERDFMRIGHPAPFTLIRAENPIRVPLVQRKSNEYSVQHPIIGMCNSIPHLYTNIIPYPQKPRQKVMQRNSFPKKHGPHHIKRQYNGRKTFVFSKEKEEVDNINIRNVKKNGDLDRKRNIIQNQINKLNPFIWKNTDDKGNVIYTNPFVSQKNEFNISSFSPYKHEDITKIEYDISQNEITNETTIEIED